MNNFDQSSTGVNVEFSGCYNTYLSQDEFNENFEILRYSSYSDNSLSVFTDYGTFSNLSPEFTSDKPMKEILWQLFGSIYNSYSFENLKDFIEYLHNYADRIRDITVSDIVEILEEDHDIYNDLDVFEDCYLKPNFEIIGINGYSQGDHAEVILFDDVKNSFGDGFNFAELFRNYFYDAPVYACLTVNNKDYYLDEFLATSYEWNKDKALEVLFKNYEFSDIEKREIEKVVPDALDYN